MDTDLDTLDPFLVYLGRFPRISSYVRCSARSGIAGAHFAELVYLVLGELHLMGLEPDRVERLMGDRAWFRSTAEHKALVRAVRTVIRHERPDATATDPVLLDAFCAGPESDPDDETEGCDRLRSLASELLTILNGADQSDPDIRVVVLKLRDRLTFAEISRHTGLPPSTAHDMFRRGVRRLADGLDRS